MSTSDPIDEQPTRGFLQSRTVIGLVVTSILIVAYVFAVTSYGRGLEGSLPAQTPPDGGIALVFVPTQMLPDAQEAIGTLLLFPSAALTDEAGRLTTDVLLTATPALSGASLLFAAGQVPSPQALTLPAPGTVQAYPFDSYRIATELKAASESADLPVVSSVYLKLPGWGYADASAGSMLSGTVTRAGSTVSIALLLLVVMVALASIAVLVVRSSTRGRMKLELGVASWMTALLFALIPIRGFFPGAPPLGSWMDVLVFFWVELVLMVSVGLIVASILLRAREQSARQEP